ncbi:MAG: hypothetical protein ACRDQ6_20645 [Pseudonocardiaceae bacterium]
MRSAQGPIVVADQSYRDAPRPDVVLVPCGIGIRTLVQDRSFGAWLAAWALQAELVTSICTGSGVLAAARPLGRLPRHVQQTGISLGAGPGAAGGLTIERGTMARRRWRRRRRRRGATTNTRPPAPRESGRDRPSTSRARHLR